METPLKTHATRAPLRGLILSAGRTGTVYLASGLQRLYPATKIRHEPSGSRRLYLRANMNKYLGLDTGGLANKFMTHFNNAALGEHGYIEINPFLCPLCPALAASVADVNVVHVVRHPATWAPSLIQHGASGMLRHFIRLVPFHTPIVDDSLTTHFGMSYLQRILWRWLRFNLNIAALRHTARSYTLIRFEELFSDKPNESRFAMQALLDGLGMPPCETAGTILKAPSLNTSRHRDNLAYTHWSVADKAYLHDALSVAMRDFGYDPDAMTP